MADISGPSQKDKLNSTFDLNLAPFLDIIVSIIPMLLLSTVFIQIRVIETPIPKVVAQAIEEASKKAEKEVVLSLKVSKTKGFEFVIENNGKSEKVVTPLKGGKLDALALAEVARKIKERFPAMFQLKLSPDRDVNFEEIVQTMDSVRKQQGEVRKIAFVDPQTGQSVQTDLMFPNIVFGNVVEE